MPNSAVDVDAGAPNLASYANNGDGVIADLVTGLLWEKTIAQTTLSLADAQAHCAALNLGNSRGWRVPTLIELVSLLDYSTAPTANHTFFPGLPRSPEFWTTTPAGSDCGFRH